MDRFRRGARQSPETNTCTIVLFDSAALIASNYIVDLKLNQFRFVVLKFWKFE